MTGADAPPEAAGDPEIAAIPADLLSRMIEVRRHLHAHPELSNAEGETQRYLRDCLAGEGMMARPAAGTGLVVDVEGLAPTSNRRLAVRADIDALPIHEATGLPFASVHPGVMHACGHDAHAAMVFAAAATLHRQRAHFGGTVRFIFQPAEEAEPLGGRRIVAEGHLRDMDAAIGLHVDPFLATGQVALGVGPYTLASDIFDIVITGRSAHAAESFRGVDAIAIGCAVVGELQKIVARETAAFDPLIVSVTGFAGGGAYNIIADRVTLRGTVRSGRAETRLLAQRRLREIATGIAAAHGGEARVEIVSGEPPVINDAGMVAVVAAAAGAALGDSAVVTAPGWTAADDFGFYSEAVPSVYFRLGVADPAGGVAFALHHPRLHVDEAALPLGAKVLVGSILGFLGGAMKVGAPR